MKKIKIMLAGFVNYPNAQNINCDNIAKYLDKNKFEVHVLYIGGRFIDKKAYKRAGIKLHYVNQHRYLHQFTLWKALNFGKYDIYYMPKADKEFRNFILKNNSKKFIASSIEGVITDKDLTGDGYYYKGFMIENTYKVFSISNCIAESVEKYYQTKTDVLPLGVIPNNNENSFARKAIKSIVWVGNIKSNKRPLYLIEIAKAFPNLSFTMIGDGEMLETVKNETIKNNLLNVNLTGRIPNKKVYKYMIKSDLLLMTSEYEGLPKVIQEAAQCGVPSIYMANNYTVDFIENGVNGFAVYSLDEMKEKLQELCADNQLYQTTSQNVKKTIEQYTWDKLIKRYEDWFVNTLEKFKSQRKFK